jgi:hypothetical protein
MSTDDELGGVGCLDAAWRNVTVRFAVDPAPATEIAVGPAVRAIELELARMRAAEQVASVVGPGWATWTFLPGSNEPAELVQVVCRVLAAHDPGCWLIEADDEP